MIDAPSDSQSDGLEYLKLPDSQSSALYTPLAQGVRETGLSDSQSKKYALKGQELKPDSESGAPSLSLLDYLVALCSL